MNKASWGPGPWQSEPDLVAWWTRGLPCLAARGPAGSWCGYVAVPRGHPYYHRDYDHCRVECHGGLTFCGQRLPGEGWWWLGWDYAHAFDYMPALGAVVADLMRERPEALPGRRETYWPLALVSEEVETVARRLAVMPVRHLKRRLERKWVNRFREDTRSYLVRVAGEPEREPRLPGYLAIRTRNALRRLENYPVRLPRLPRSLRGYVGAA